MRKRELSHKHWFGLSLICIILAGIIAGVITLVILGSPQIIESITDQPVPKGETNQITDLECVDPNKYLHPKLGCICKEEYRSSTNFRGTFCLEKGRQINYWPE